MSDLTVDDLQLILDQLGFSPRAYTLTGGTRDDRYHIEHQGRRWDVYFVERGQRYDTKSYDSLVEAARALVWLMLEDPTTLVP